MQMIFALAGLLVVIGAVHCGDNSFNAVLLNSKLYDSDASPGTPFWWMSKGSPFKRAVAAGPPSQQFDFGSNPFLNRGNSAKLYSAPGYLPPDQPTQPPTVPCVGNGRVCVPKYQCSNGAIDANQVRGSGSQECNVDSEVCCTVRQPPAPRPTPPAPRPTQPQPQPTPSPTTTRNSYIPPPAPTRSQPQPTPCAQPSVCVPQYQCQNGQVSRNSPAASRGPASSCLQPEVCCRVQEEPRPTPSVNVITYQPSPSTQRPYVTQAVQTPRPVVITKKPFIGQQYIPPRDNEVPAGNNPIGQYLPPNRGEDEKSEPIPNNSNDTPSLVRPTGQPGEAESPGQIPNQCSAALLCTEKEYCDASATISKSIVSLTQDQEERRAPMTDCRIASSGKLGKCCRDPDYTDPWPTNLLRTGAFDANVLAQAFDDGQYRPNGNNGQRKRGEELKSPNIFIPQQSQTTKSYTNAPFNPNAISSTNNKPSVPQPSTPLNPFNNQPQAPFSSPQPFFNAQQSTQGFRTQSVTPTKSSFIQKSYTPQAQNLIQPSQPTFKAQKFSNQPNVPSQQQQFVPLSGQQQFVPPSGQQQFVPQSGQQQFVQPQQPAFNPQVGTGQQFVQPQQPSFNPQSPNGQQIVQPQQPSFSPQSPGVQKFVQPQQPSFNPQVPSGQQFVQPQQPSFNPQSPGAQQIVQPQQPSFNPQSPGAQQIVQPQQPSFNPQVPSGQQFVQPQQPSFNPQSPGAQQIVQPQQPSFNPQSPGVQRFVQPQQPSFNPQVPSGQQFVQPQQPSFNPQSPGSSYQPLNPFKSNQLGVCAVRDTQGLPRGTLPNEAAFGEFPWQAMVLRESTKTILCGGAIIEKNVVATTASCVDGLRTHDVLIKAGEWKLGSTEEPKPFQTVRVKQIVLHPAYQPTNLESDIALLHLESDLKYDNHIGAICLDETELEPAGSNEECVTSGWGKENIKYHVSGAIPHSLAINPLNSNECQASLSSYNPNSAVCGRAEGNPCDVDVGSALACTRGNGRYLLKGIYSGQSGCGPNQVMSFTKMDVNFIRGHAEKSLPIQQFNQSPEFGQRIQLESNKPTTTSFSYQTPAPSASSARGYLPPNSK